MTENGKTENDNAETFVSQKVTYTANIEGRVIIVENVPARVSSRTGERFFSPETVGAASEHRMGKESPLPYIRARLEKWDKLRRIRIIGREIGAFLPIAQPTAVSIPGLYFERACKANRNTGPVSHYLALPRDLGVGQCFWPVRPGDYGQAWKHCPTVG